MTNIILALIICAVFYGAIRLAYNAGFNAFYKIWLKTTNQKDSNP